MMWYGIMRFSESQAQYKLCDFGYTEPQSTTTSKKEAITVLGLKRAAQPKQDYFLVKITKINEE